MATVEFERSKAFLKKANSEGVSLYDHLTNVLLTLGKEKPADPVVAFESLSRKVKGATLVLPQFKELPPFQQEPAIRNETITAVEAVSELVQSAKSSEPKGEEPVFAPDIMNDANLFEWAGVSLGRDVYLKLMFSIERLIDSQLNKSPSQPIKEVRFFGKIFGLRADYYIVEAKFVENPEVKFKEIDRVEPPGQGSNEHVYFVSNHPEGKWTQLPWVIPAMIQTSKQMRRYFTGDLRAPVLGYPRFPWGEAAYLRAQIERIASACIISPRDYFSAEEADEESLPAVMMNEEFEEVPAMELTTVEGWQHHRRFLLNQQGRVLRFNEEAPEEEEENEDAVEPEEPPAFLSNLEEDKVDKKEGLKNIWTFRKAPRAPHTVVSAQNLNWPGAVAVCRNKGFANIYVGFGHKYLNGLFTPPPPPAIMSEFKSVWDPENDEVDPILEQKDPEPRVKGDKDSNEDDEDDVSDDEDDD